jgi:hypothetical protein
MARRYRKLIERVNLTEGYLHKVVRESVNKLLREEHELDKYELSDDYYTVDELSYANAKEAYFTPSDGHISVNGPEGYEDGEVEIPFQMVPVFEADDDWWKVESIYADAVTSDENTKEYQLFVQYEDAINNILTKHFDFYKDYFDDVKTP